MFFAKNEKIKKNRIKNNAYITQMYYHRRHVNENGKKTDNQTNTTIR
jgi:hypothetical protein